MKFVIKLYILFLLNFYYLIIIIKNETCQLRTIFKRRHINELQQLYIRRIDIIYFTFVAYYIRTVTQISHYRQMNCQRQANYISTILLTNNKQLELGTNYFVIKKKKKMVLKTLTQLTFIVKQTDRKVFKLSLKQLCKYIMYIYSK